MKNKRLNGFTFIELIFAITVMGVLFSLATTVIIGMIRFYTFTNTVRTNQQNARSILNTVSKDAADGQVEIINLAGTDSSILCIKKSSEIITYSLEKISGILTRRSYNSQFQDNCQQLVGRTVVSETKMNDQKLIIYAFKQSLLSQGARTVANNNVTSLILEATFVTSNSAPQDLLTVQGNEGYSVCVPGDIYCNTLRLNTAVKTSKWK